jgi:hypothetical protein
MAGVRDVKRRKNGVCKRTADSASVKICSDFSRRLGYTNSPGPAACPPPRCRVPLTFSFCRPSRIPCFPDSAFLPLSPHLDDPSVSCSGGPIVCKPLLDCHYRTVLALRLVLNRLIPELGTIKDSRAHLARSPVVSFRRLFSFLRLTFGPNAHTHARIHHPLRPSASGLWVPYRPFHVTFEGRSHVACTSLSW